MLYIQESLENVNIERAEYARLTNPEVVPYQRVADLIEVEDSSAARTWIFKNSLTIITTSAAQTIYDVHVDNGDEEARILS